MFSVIQNTPTRSWYKFHPVMRKSIIAIFLALGTLPGHAQVKSIDFVRQQYDPSHPDGLYEKIFVHTDKTVYLAGELIWFKIYQVDGYKHQPIDVSKVSYVEIISSEKKVVLQGKIEMNSGAGKGSFLIPPSLPSGNYLLRAYTNWMKNFSVAGYFEKQVTIINSLKRPDWKTITDPGYDLQVFPEGGNLVEGITSKVAFRITDQNGKGVDCSGLIVNQNNDTIAIIKTARFGIGNFTFTPKHGYAYRAILKVNNSTVSKELPAAYTKGYVMQLTAEENDQLRITVNTNNSVAASPVHLVVHKKQMIQIAMVSTIQSGKAVFNIDKRQCLDGISYFTLFDDSGKPLCERLYFKRPHQRLHINVSTDNSSYGTKQPVNVSVTTFGDTSRPLQADMSVSVFLVDSLQGADGADIFNYLWLDSELEGSVESLGYYSTTTGSEYDHAIDDLMLTHGWRRFDWDDTVTNKRPLLKYLPEYEGHLINGRVVHKRTGNPGRGITGFLSIPGQRFAFSNAVSDDEGHIRFVVKDFIGTEEVIVQTDHRKDSAYRIEIANPFSEALPSHSLTPFDLSEKHKNFLVTRSIGVQAQNFYLTDSIRRFLLPQYSDTTSFYGKPDKEYFLDDYTRFITMEEVLREFVTELRLRKQRDSFHFQVLNHPYKTFFDAEPLLLLDGVPVFDVNRIVSFDPLKIRKLDVITQRYYHGPMTNYGIVSYKTYEGDLGGFQLDPNALVVEYDGLQLQREFYSPVYSPDNKTQNRLPDFRNVLYWSPDVTTATNGKGQFSFYTSEITGTYAVVVTGITKNGFAGSSVTTFSVTASPR